MRNQNYLLFFLIICLIYSCSDTNEDLIEIEKTNFENEVPLGFTFEFYFNESIVSDTLLNIYEEESVLSFDPFIEGKYYWKNNYTLVFSPTSYLSPATYYTVRLKTDQFINDVKAKEFEKTFHSPLLSLESNSNYWDASSGQGEAELHGTIKFNYDVNVQSLKQKSQFKLDNEVKQIQFLTEGKNNSIDYIIKDVPLIDDDQNGTLIIDKGLMESLGGSSWSESAEIKVEIASPFKLNISHIKADHDGTFGTIMVSTSQSVSTEGLKEKIEITPKINFELENGQHLFSIRSAEFDINKKYTVKILEGIRGKLGGKLKSDVQKDISFGELEPSIRFSNRKNLYLSRNGQRNIEVSIVNVEKVKLEIYKVYENNLIDFLNGRDYYYGEYYYDDYYRGDGGYVGNRGDLIFEEAIITQDLPIKGNKRLLNFKFEDKIKNYDGMYMVKLISEEDRWLNASKMVALSDLGLIVKEGKESVSVFVNSIENTKPIAGSSISLFGKNNQKIKSVKTDANGVAIIPLSEHELRGFQPRLITARTSSDFNFIHLGNTSIDNSRFDVGGMRLNDTGWMAYIYPERDLYRPGETAHFSAILRDMDWNTPGKVPVLVKVYSPDGSVFKEMRKSLDQEGAFETKIDFPAETMTGTYSINLMTSNEVHLKTSYLKVEEFVPDRIKVKTTLNAEDYMQGDSIALELLAENLFGPPAIDRNFEVQLNIKKSYFSSPDYPDFNFYLDNVRSAFDHRIHSGKTDKSGIGKASFPISNIYKNMGKLKASLNSTVFDETGRPVNRINTADIFTQNVFFGINGGSYYRKTNRPASVSIVAVDKEGKLSPNSEASIQLIRHEYRTVLSKSGRYFRYRSQHEEKIIENKTIKIGNQPLEYTFTPEVSGRYEVRVSGKNANAYVSQNFYCYGYGRTRSNSFQVNNEGKIDIVLDKDNYLVGDKAKVLMKTPFSGKALITIESDNVIEHFYQETDNKALAFDLDIQSEHLPNVYITATLFRAHKESDLPLTIAHGYIPVKVDDPKREIDVKIEAASSSRSNQKQKIKVTGRPNSQMTIAVVDEGILQVSGFETPKPYSYFYQKRALNVNSYNIYPFLFPEMVLSNGKPGGGAALKKRINPLTNKRFELLSFWSGMLQTDENGKGEFEIDIPQFSGELRIMAVDYKGKNFGSAESSMKVADPIVISGGIPRFLSPRDTVDLIYTITNTTSQSAQISSKLSLEGPLKIIGKTAQNAELIANEEQRIIYKIIADAEIGQAKISLVVDGLNETFNNSTNITVRPASPLQKRSGSGSIEAGAIQELNLETENFIENSIDRKLILSTSPMIEFRKDLDYLIQYPHGCLEQTTSRAFPQIYIEDIMQEVMGKDFKETEARRNVQAAIEKLKTMQLYNGGFTYWSGMGNENWWASTYATHFLVEAKKAGYHVDDEFLNPALNYLNSRLKDKNKVDYWYNGNLNRKITPKTVAYSLYVLALAEMPNKSIMNYHKAHLDDLALDSRYLLAASFRMIGDEKSYSELLPFEFGGEVSNRALAGSFYSRVRDEAISLNALLEVEPNSPQIPVMTRHLADQLKNSSYLNTQERSFSLLALGKVSKANSHAKVQADIKIGSDKIAEFNNEPLTLYVNKLMGDKCTIQTNGEGQLYFFWETEGIDKNGEYKEEDSHLAVRKKFYTREGKVIQRNRLKQNDLVIVKISIRSLENKRVENVAITDILPAGLEIENPRLKNVPGVNWIKDKSYPEFMDIRDDRITYFLTSTGTEKHFYYMARAVTPGVFQMGPVGADAMYNGEFHSYNGGGILSITK
ncbi:MAG: alpha-2-macroglobulin [Bacteroidota bacterium]